MDTADDVMEYDSIVSVQKYFFQWINYVFYKKIIILGGFWGDFLFCCFFRLCLVDFWNF